MSQLTLTPQAKEALLKLCQLSRERHNKTFAFADLVIEGQGASEQALALAADLWRKDRPVPYQRPRNSPPLSELKQKMKSAVLLYHQLTWDLSQAVQAGRGTSSEACQVAHELKESYAEFSEYCRQLTELTLATE